MGTQRLTIHLLRDVSKADDAIEPDKARKEVPIQTDSSMVGTFYYTSRPPTPPSWVSFVREVAPSLPTTLTSSSASGLLIVQAHGRFFALTFGYGRSLLNLTKVERQFGLRVALNRIDPRQLRSMDTKTFEDLVVTKTTQASKSADLPTFGVDVSRDILRAVTGRPRDTTLAKQLTGSDALVLNTSTLAKDLPDMLSELLTAFSENNYKDDFEWIDHLALVNDATIIHQLDNQLAGQLAAGDTSTTHMAMPEAIDWEDIESFKITGTRNSIYEDLDIDEYLARLGDKRAGITVDRLRGRRVSVGFARSSDYDSRWTLYQCLVSEQPYNSALYALIEGRWFAISDSLAAEVDNYTNSLPSVGSTLISSRFGEDERTYNANLAESNAGTLLLLDAKIKRPGGATTGIELCDVLSSTGELIHVKRKSRSSTLSHLFSQGVVSANTFIGDGEFRDKMREVIATQAGEENKAQWLAMIPPSGQSIDRSKYTVSYVVIASSKKEGNSWLPFFSKLNLMQQAKQLRNLGVKVSISRVPVEGN